MSTIAWGGTSVVEYETIQVPVGSSNVNHVRLKMCKRCGVFVASTTLHDEAHKAASTAAPTFDFGGRDSD